jgi:hypothetical protein
MARLRERLAIWATRLVTILAFVGAVAAAYTDHRELLQPLVLLSVLLAPVLLPRRLLYPPPDGSGGGAEDDGGGGGRGPQPRPRSPDGPRGGLPLPDADPAQARIRDHRRPALGRLRPRRAPHGPERAPSRIPHGATQA